MLANYQNESKSIETEIVEMVYYMNGSITYTEAFETSYENRKNIMETLKGIKKREAGK